MGAGHNIIYVSDGAITDIASVINNRGTGPIHKSGSEMGNDATRSGPSDVGAERTTVIKSLDGNRRGHGSGSLYIWTMR